MRKVATIRFSVPIDDRREAELLLMKGYEILKIDPKPREGLVAMTVLIDNNEPLRNQRFHIIPSHEELPESATPETYVGSVHMRGDDWHIFDRDKFYE